MEARMLAPQAAHEGDAASPQPLEGQDRGGFPGARADEDEYGLCAARGGKRLNIACHEGEALEGRGLGLPLQCAPLRLDRGEASEGFDVAHKTLCINLALTRGA